MYLSHFSIERNPFALAPDPAFYFETESHRLAMSVLEYSVRRANDLCLLTGEVGSGKTLLLRMFIDRVRSSARVGVVYQTHEAFGDLMDWVFDAFELDPPEDRSLRIRHFRSFLGDTERGEVPPVLIIDEAQNLSKAELDAVRVLSNLNADGRQRLQLILVGQPELRKTLRSGEMRQLVQRISVDFHLKPLTFSELSGYVQHRLHVAGCSQALFTDEALKAIHEYGCGIPRVTNSLCDLALVFAHADGATQVTRASVDEVVAEKCGEGLYWIPEPPAQVLPFTQTNGSAAQIAQAGLD